MISYSEINKLYIIPFMHELINLLMGMTSLINKKSIEFYLSFSIGLCAGQRVSQYWCKINNPSRPVRFKHTNKLMRKKKQLNCTYDHNVFQ